MHQLEGFENFNFEVVIQSIIHETLFLQQKLHHTSHFSYVVFYVLNPDMQWCGLLVKSNAGRGGCIPLTPCRIFDVSEPRISSYQTCRLRRMQNIARLSVSAFGCASFSLQNYYYCCVSHLQLQHIPWSWSGHRCTSLPSTEVLRLEFQHWVIHPRVPRNFTRRPCTVLCCSAIEPVRCLSASSCP